MSEREEQLESLLTDVTMTARHVLKQPTLGAARDELRRACDRVGEHYKAEKAQHRLEGLTPNASDPRPEPPPDRCSGQAPKDTPQQRLPYRDD